MLIEHKATLHIDTVVTAKTRNLSRQPSDPAGPCKQ